MRFLPLIILFWAELIYAEPPNFTPISFAIETNSGEHRFHGELAVTPQQTAYGLMFRTEISDNYAMIFDFVTPRHASFWMKNTLLNLDMIFVRSNGVIANIISNVPALSLDQRRSHGKVRWVIEIKANQVKNLGIKTGDRLKL